jgi:hypothetical protein
MTARPRTPVVPLEAGAGPENPPCPACGEPLFGWIDERPGIGGPVSRCESCGLAVIGAPGDGAEALRALDRLATNGELTITNRAGLSAWIGGAGWAGLEERSRYLFTTESVRRLVAVRDQVVARVRWAPSAGIAAMWQTILNGFTFGRNVGLSWLGISPAAPAESAWQRGIDRVITVVVAIPVMIVAATLESAAAAAGRGSVLRLRLRAL